MLDANNVKMVRRVVARCLPLNCDREAVVAEIMFEALKNKVPFISARHAKNRCIDLIRRIMKERKASEGFLRVKPEQKDFTKDIENTDMVEACISVLTIEERKLTWYRFWRGLTMKEIAVLSKLTSSEVSRRIEGALYKMKQAIR